MPNSPLFQHQNSLFLVEQDEEMNIRSWRFIRDLYKRVTIFSLVRVKLKKAEQIDPAGASAFPENISIQPLDGAVIAEDALPAETGCPHP